MAFIAKNPIVSPQTNSPPVPPPNTRGIFPKDDGWYEIDDNGNVRKLINRSSKSVPNDISAVTEIIRCATSYLNHKADFTFTDSGKGTLFDDDFSADSPKIDCSSLMMAWAMGIPYEYSKYAGKNNSKHYDYGIKLPTNPYAADRPNRYYTHELAHYFDDQGWCFVPDKNYSDIAPGDIIFVSFKSRDGNSDFHDNAYMKIDHCLLVIGYKDPTHLICLHTSDTYTLNYYDVCVLPSDYDSTSANSYNNGIKLVARLPFKAANNISKEPIFIDSTSFTTTNTTNGFLRTITLDEPLKQNTAYTLVASVENAFTQTKPSTNNYFGVRVSYADGTADENILSWAKNAYPEDNLYRCHFVTGDKIITKIKLYILSCTVAGHKYNYSVLYEGSVSTTPTDDDISNGVSIKESTSNKVTTLNTDSTDTQYPSAKAVYDELVKKADMDNLGLQCVNLGYFEKIADFEKLNIVDDCYGYFTVEGQTWVDGSYNLSVTGDFTNEKESHMVTLVGSSCTVFFLVVSEHQPSFSDETVDYGHQVFYDGRYVYERGISKNTTDGTTTFTYSNPAKNSFYGYERLTNKVTGIYSDSTDKQYPSAKAVYTALLKKVNTADLGLQCTDFGYFDSYSKFYKLDPGSQITSNRYGYFSTNKNIWLGALSNAKENGNFKTSNDIPSDSSNDKDITIFFVTRKGNTITNEQGNSETTFYQSFWDDCNNIYHRTIVSEEIVHENQGGNISIGGSSGGSTITWYEYNYTYEPLTESQINDIGKKADKTTITTSTEATASITLADNTELRFAELTSLTVALPETLSDSFISSVVFKSGATATTVTVPSEVYCQGADCKNGAFLPKANKRYTMIFSYDGVMNYYIAAVPIQTSETQSEDVTEDETVVMSDETTVANNETVAEETESEPNEVI